MNSRDSILGSLHAAKPDKSTERPAVVKDRDVFLNIAASREEMLAQFIQRQENLSGEVIVCADLPDLAEKLFTILQDFAPSSCLYHTDPLINQVFDTKPALKEFFESTDISLISSSDFSHYQAGLTAVDFLAARTGSLVINSISAGGRRLSVLPPVHIALARENQLVPSLDAAMAQMPGDSMNWSYATIITGPSRTSDIEKKLVLGAHGPKRLITLILKE